MKDEYLEINENVEDEFYKVYAKGRVDSTNAGVLQYKLEHILNEGNKAIILNMAQIEYLSSIGIRIILNIYKQAAKSGGSFRIENPSEIVRNVLGIVALKELLVS